MFETHDSWQKKYFLAEEEQFKSWYCVQLKNNRPWFIVKFTYIENIEIQHEIFISDEYVLKDFSERPHLKILEVYVVTSPKINNSNHSRMNKLVSIYSACNGKDRDLRFLLYELEGGKYIAHPAEYYDENLNDVSLLFTTLDHNLLDILNR